jgi:hypothetical protein
MTQTATRAILCCLLASSCRKADTDNSASLHDTCEAWCEVAVPCSEHFAGPEWGDFSTNSECEDVCKQEIEQLTEKNPACFHIMLDLRSCAAALTCEEFKNYENWSFVKPWSPPIECVEEDQARDRNCNL